jgi:hypothetical protein
MKRLFALGALIALPAFASAQSPDYSSGNYWYDICTRSDLDAQALCVTFVSSLTEGLTLGSLGASIWILRATKARDVDGGAKEVSGFVMGCAPDGVTNRQNVDIFVSYLRGHPESRQKNAGVLYVNALREAFPCK